MNMFEKYVRTVDIMFGIQSIKLFYDIKVLAACRSGTRMNGKDCL